MSYLRPPALLVRHWEFAYYPIDWQGVQLRGSAMRAKTFYALGASRWDSLDDIAVYHSRLYSDSISFFAFIDRSCWIY